MDVILELKRKEEENLRKIYEKYERFTYYRKSPDSFIDKDFERKILNFIKERLKDWEAKMIWDDECCPFVILKKKGRNDFEVKITGNGISMAWVLINDDEDSIDWDEKRREEESILREIYEKLGYEYGCDNGDKKKD